MPGRRQGNSVAELVLNGDDVASVATTFEAVGAAGYVPVCPSVSAVGSDAVISAFAISFGLIRDSEQNVRAGWSRLGSRARQAVADMAAVDAALAVG